MTVSVVFRTDLRKYLLYDMPDNDDDDDDDDDNNNNNNNNNTMQKWT